MHNERKITGFVQNIIEKINLVNEASLLEHKATKFVSTIGTVNNVTQKIGTMILDT